MSFRVAAKIPLPTTGSPLPTTGTPANHRLPPGTAEPQLGIFGSPIVHRNMERRKAPQIGGLYSKAFSEGHRAGMKTSFEHTPDGATRALTVQKVAMRE